MLLHDMMFSCVEVPDFDQKFVDEVVREVEYNVKRLRNHVSIVVWSGANEADCMPEWGVRPRPNGEYYGYHLYHRVFPDIIAKLDPSRPYMPADPCPGKNNPDRSVLNPKHGTYHGNFGTSAFSTDDEIDRAYQVSSMNATPHRRARLIPCGSILKIVNWTGAIRCSKLMRSFHQR